MEEHNTLPNPRFVHIDGLPAVYDEHQHVYDEESIGLAFDSTLCRKGLGKIFDEIKTKKRAILENFVAHKPFPENHPLLLVDGSTKVCLRFFATYKHIDHANIELRFTSLLPAGNCLGIRWTVQQRVSELFPGFPLWHTVFERDDLVVSENGKVETDVTPVVFGPPYMHGDLKVPDTYVEFAVFVTRDDGSRQWNNNNGQNHRVVSSTSIKGTTLSDYVED